jgi:hypothetical protein
MVKGLNSMIGIGLSHIRYVGVAVNVGVFVTVGVGVQVHEALAMHN